MLNPVWDPTVPGPRDLRRHQPGRLPRLRHRAPGSDPLSPRVPRRGGRVWVLDPRRTETAALADGYVPVRPGADVAVLAALANALLERGADERELRDHCDADRGRGAARRARARSRIERAAAVADVDPALLEQLVADVRAHRGPRRDALRHRRDDVPRRRARRVAALGRAHRVGLARSRGRHALPPRRRPPAPPAQARRPHAPGRRAARADPSSRGCRAGPGGRARRRDRGRQHPRAVRHRRQPAHRVPAAGPARGRAGERSTCSRSSTSPRTRSPRSRRTCCPATGQLERADITLAELTALRSGLQATRPGRRSRSPTAARSGGCSRR